MKRLRNIAIIYILVGVLCGISWHLFAFWRVAIIGLFLGLLYLALRCMDWTKRTGYKFSKKQLIAWDFFLYLHLILLLIGIYWYITKPFNQTIIIPKGYEGVVDVTYNETKGQPEVWINTFLGLGGSRLIKVDKNGYGKTQFRTDFYTIPFFEITHSPFNEKGIQIYYENDLNNEIPLYRHNAPKDDEKYVPEGTEKEIYEELKKQNVPVAYLVDMGTFGVALVVCKIKDYYKYFYSDEEVKALEKKNPQNKFQYSDYHNLKERYFDKH